MPETLTLTVNGQRHERWEEIRVTREIDRMCTDFNIAVSERFLPSASDFPLAPFQECTVAIDVVVQTDVGASFPDATIERHKTGFAAIALTMRCCRDQAAKCNGRRR
jgi:prophage tail gpP-like protein